jgi:hypothetical protein
VCPLARATQRRARNVVNFDKGKTKKNMKNMRKKSAILMAAFALICLAGSKKLKACCDPSYQSCACFDSNGNQISCGSGSNDTEPDPSGGIGD